MFERIRNRDERGFTLVELLIVIVVLGILAGIVVFAVGSARDDSIVSACKADKRTLQSAVEAFKAKDDSGAYPATLNALVPDYVRELPDSDEYSFNYAAASGAVTEAADVC